MPPVKRRAGQGDGDGGDTDPSGSGPARPRIVVRMRQPASGRSSAAHTADSSRRSSPAPGAADEDVDDEEPLYEEDVVSSGESRSPSPSYIRKYGGNKGKKAKGGASSARNADAMRIDGDEAESGDDEGQGEDVGRFDGVAKDFTGMQLKPDHASRPLWINPEDGHIILEGFSPIAEQAQDFLVAIAEPVSRPSFIHEYKLTPYSLYAAVSVGLNPNDIIEVLNRLSKCPVPKDIHEFIRGYTAHFGKIKLVLKQNRYYIESAHPEVLRTLLNDKVIGDARVRDSGANDNGNGRMAVLGREQAPTRGDLVIPGTEGAARKAAAQAQAQQRAGQRSTGAVPQQRVNPGGQATGPQAESDAAAAREAEADLFASIIGGNEPDDGAEDDEDTVHSFEILEEHIEKVKQRCNEIGYPLLEEYDFRKDHVNADLEIDLKPITHIRPYQEKSLSKMFGNGRARSGIIVLPCGAGKTLVGITAACTIKKSCLVLCTSTVSVMQWRQQFIQWSSIQENQISVFTAEQKAKFAGASGIVVSTYSMVANTGKRSHTAQKMMNFLESREWGFIILDEVHVVPAAMFRRVLTRIKAHSKLGLTATLVREDEKIDELNFLVGPKLYEANWMELAAKGHIATVQCAEVWCPMTPEFYREYLREKPRKKTLLHCMNPNKFQACQFLINYHEARGDKIIVFSDNVYALEAYATRLKKLYIHGNVAQTERMRILQHFQHDPAVSTIFLSKVGDTSIDLPEATCLIQISSHFGSRRQEAQRLGRILRAKRRNDEGFNAFFYSLVSHSTIEMYYSTRRQQFLVDQGYAFRVITHLEGMKEMPDLVFKTQSEQIELLQSVLIANDSAGEIGGEMAGDDYGANTGVGSKNGGQRRLGGPPPKAMRSTGSLSALSGAQHVSYVERNLSANANPALKKSHKRLLAAKGRR